MCTVTVEARRRDCQESKGCSAEWALGLLLSNPVLGSLCDPRRWCPDSRCSVLDEGVAHSQFWMLTAAAHGSRLTARHRPSTIKKWQSPRAVQYMYKWRGRTTDDRTATRKVPRDPHRWQAQWQRRRDAEMQKTQRARGRKRETSTPRHRCTGGTWISAGGH